MKKAVLAILIIGLVTAGGWFGYTKYQDKNTTKISSSPNTQSSSTATNPTQDVDYLVIKEWNVRFEIPHELKGTLGYEDRKNEEIETLAITSNQADLESCAPIAITRSNNVGFGQYKVGAYYFDFLKAPAACDVSNSSKQTKAAQLQSKIYNALNTLEEVN